MSCDQKVKEYVKQRTAVPFKGVEASLSAVYDKVIREDLSSLPPQIAKPHEVDKVVDVDQVTNVDVDQVYIGTCTNGRLEDLREAAAILDGNHIARNVRMIIAPSSKDVLLAAMSDGTIDKLVKAGGTLIAPSCGPCVGTCNGVPVRRGGRALHRQPQLQGPHGQYQGGHLSVLACDRGVLGHAGPHSRCQGGAGMKQLSGKAHTFGDNLNTDYVISGKYKFKTLDMNELAKHVMEDIRPGFYDEIAKGDFVVAGENLGAGSSREQAPLVLKAAGIGAVVASSFARIFYRNCINVGLPVVEVDTSGIAEGDALEIDIEKGMVRNVTKGVTLEAKPLPPVMMKILTDGGLAEHIKSTAASPWRTKSRPSEILSLFLSLVHVHHSIPHGVVDGDLGDVRRVHYSTQ